jgi:translation initiation factor 1
MAKPSKGAHVPVDEAPSGRSGVTLGALLQRAGLAPPTPQPAVPSKPPAPAEAAKAARAPGAPTSLSDVARVVVRRERKGHGGHTATVLEGLGGLDLDALAKQLKRALGCGASVTEAAVVLQGDVADRACAWLEGQGVRRVVRGS